MDWSAGAIDLMLDARNDLLERIDRFSTGTHRLWELTDGRHDDVTDATVARLRATLARVEILLTEAGISLES